MKVNKGPNDRRVILSTLWVFYLVNILYADVFSLVGAVFGPGAAATTAEDVELITRLTSPQMLLAAAIFLETAMVMIVLSRLLKHGMNRWANIIVATLHTAGLLASLLVGTPTIYYIFFVIVEVTTLLVIVWYAWHWKTVHEYV